MGGFLIVITMESVLYLKKKILQQLSGDLRNYLFTMSLYVTYTTNTRCGGDK